jgi:hypothetical protein
VGRQRQPLHPKLLYEWAVYCTFHCAVVVPEEEPDPVMQKKRLDASVCRLSCSLPLLENHVRMKTAFISNRRRHVRTCKSSRPDLESKRHNALIVLLCNKKVGYISPSIAMARQYTNLPIKEKSTKHKCLFRSLASITCSSSNHSSSNISRTSRRQNPHPLLHPLIIQNKLAPPLSIASISASLYTVRLNLTGSSLRSQNSPSFGCTLPNCLAVLPPIPPSAWETEGACEAPLLLERIMGPCWLAFWR